MPPSHNTCRHQVEPALLKTNFSHKWSYNIWENWENIKLLQYYYPWVAMENIVFWSSGNQCRIYLKKDDIIHDCGTSISMPSHAENKFWCIRFHHVKQNFPSTWCSFYVSSKQFMHTCTHLCGDTMFWCFVYCWRGLFSHTNTTVCLDLQQPQITFLWRNYCQKHAQFCLFVSTTSVLLSS